jgi:hypothetical protein
MDFITNKLIIVSLFMLIITTVETLAYATRLSGARVGLIASALSLFNMMVIVSRLSTMIQQPLTGKLITDAPFADKLQFVASQYRIRSYHYWNLRRYIVITYIYRFIL